MTRCHHTIKRCLTKDLKKKKQIELLVEKLQPTLITVVINMSRNSARASVATTRSIGGVKTKQKTKTAPLPLHN